MVFVENSNEKKKIFLIRQNCCILRYSNYSYENQATLHFEVFTTRASECVECVSERAKTRGRYHILWRKLNTATKLYLK